jgi:hypothetical protein
LQPHPLTYIIAIGVVTAFLRSAHDQDVAMSQLNTRSNGSPSRARDPPPALFLHPSPAASHVSLVGPNVAPPASSNVHNQATVPTSLVHKGSLLNPHRRGTAPTAVPRLHTGDSSRTVDRTDALWAEMQATLAEVELSASGGTHVFGSDHDRKLADLRAAQIALAQAWARSEADDAIETSGAAAAGAMDEVRDLKGALAATGLTSAAAFGPGSAAGKTAGVEGTEPAKSTVGSGSANLSNPQGPDGLGAVLEHETELDILMARRRREANDEYFSRVDQGVRDVVAKLDEVAVAMMAVEQETRDIWGDETSLENVKPDALQ